MANLFYDISSVPPESYPYYFCDANVWIATLKSYGIGGVAKHEQPYISFVDGIINLNEIQESIIAKKAKNQPKIVLCSLLVSEILNAYMRNIAMKAFFGGGTNYKSFDFKMNYREDPASDYNKQINSLITDFLAFSDYTILFNDGFDKLDLSVLLSSLIISNIDFNDHYYHHFLKKMKIPLVTHDKDCNFPDLPILTSQYKLLRISDV